MSAAWQSSYTRMSRWSKGGVDWIVKCVSCPAKETDEWQMASRFCGAGQSKPAILHGIPGGGMTFLFFLYPWAGDRRVSKG